MTLISVKSKYGSCSGNCTGLIKINNTPKAYKWSRKYLLFFWFDPRNRLMKSLSFLNTTTYCVNFKDNMCIVLIVNLEGLSLKIWVIKKTSLSEIGSVKRYLNLNKASVQSQFL